MPRIGSNAACWPVPIATQGAPREYLHSDCALSLVVRDGPVRPATLGNCRVPAPFEHRYRFAEREHRRSEHSQGYDPPGLPALAIPGLWRPRTLECGACGLDSLDRLRCDCVDVDALPFLCPQADRASTRIADDCDDASARQ